MMSKSRESLMRYVNHEKARCGHISDLMHTISAMIADYDEQAEQIKHMSDILDVIAEEDLNVIKDAEYTLELRGERQ